MKATPLLRRHQSQHSRCFKPTCRHLWRLHLHLHPLGAGGARGVSTAMVRRRDTKSQKIEICKESLNPEIRSTWTGPSKRLVWYSCFWHHLSKIRQCTTSGESLSLYYVFRKHSTGLVDVTMKRTWRKWKMFGVWCYL